MSKGLGIGVGAAVVLVLLIAGVLTFVPSEVDESEERKGPVTVASKIDTEGALLGGMMVELLEHHGFEVIDETEFGPTDVIREAIVAGEIDIYPEYTGNGAFFFGDDAPEGVWNDADSAYDTVRDLDYEEHELIWMEPAPANNTWAIAVRSDLAEAEGLSTKEDFAEYVNQGGTVKLAASEEFVTRPDVLPAFEEEYGFELSDDQLLVFSGGNTAMTIQAAAEQQDGVNTAMAYGTDGELAALGLTVLGDNLGVQPVYEPAPLVRGDVASQYPELEDIFGPVFERLSKEMLQELNGRIAVGGEDARQVAREFLQENEFLN